MKSVHITNYYHRDSGGISTSYNKLLEAAGRHRRHVRLIVPGEIDAVENVNEYARIYFVKASFSPVFDRRYRVLMPWSAYIFDQSPVKKILREEVPQMIEVGEKYTLSLMSGLIRKGIMNIAAPRPMLVHLSCERMDDNVRSFISGNWLGSTAANAYIRNYILPMFDFHLTNSEYTADELVHAASAGSGSNGFLNACWRLLRSPTIPAADRIFVNQCGVDIKTFTSCRKSAEFRTSLFADFDFPANVKVLLYAGRLSPEKNVTLLPEIMRLLADDGQFDYRMLVAGDGPQKAMLASEFEKKAPAKVTMLGNIDDKHRLADIFANCDAFIHPNPREPFGIAPLEAMSSGLPVVAPNSGGLLSYANETNAWLIDPSAENFSSAIREVVHDAVRSAQRTRAAIKTAKQYTWEASTDALFALYDKLYAEFLAKRDLYDYRRARKDINFASEFTI